MENQGFNAEINNQPGYGHPYPSQPGYVHPYPPQTGYGQPYPSQPGYGQPYPSQPGYGQPYPSQPDCGQPQPGFAYPNLLPNNATVQPYAPGIQSQQPQVAVVGSNPAPVYVAQAKPFVSMVGAIVLSCFVFWFCGMLFGGIAFVLARHSSVSSGDTAGGIRLRNASYGLSIAGIVIGIIVIIVIGSLAGTLVNNCTYRNGIRYCTY